MALLNKTLGTRDDAQSSEDEDDELQQLESDVIEMAQKILDYKATLLDQLRTTLTSVLAAQRPVFPNGLELAPSGHPFFHSDLTFWKMKAPIGHEAVGVVESVGEHVEELIKGDLVLPVFQPNCRNFDAELRLQRLVARPYKLLLF